MRLGRAVAAVTTVVLSMSGLLPVPTASADAPPQAPNAHAVQFDPASPNPVLSWDAVPGAFRYRVQIARDGSFGSPVYERETVALQATPELNLPLGTLYWHVQAEDSSGQGGPFSPAVSFSTSWHKAPALVSPADGAVLNFPDDPAVLTWQPLSGAQSYEVQVDDGNDFIGAQDVTTANTSYVLPEPQTALQTFYWRVRAQSATSGVVSDWSPTRQYSFVWGRHVDATHPNQPLVPDLVRPSDQSTLTDPTFVWQPVPGAARYQIQVSANQDFTNNITIDQIVKGASYTPVSTLNNTSYFWRVRASDASAHDGGWSAVWSFTKPAIPAPTVVSPLPPANDPSAPATMTDTPTFAWTPVQHAAYYEVQVSPDSSFSSTVYSCTTNHTRLTPMSAGCPLDSMAWVSGMTYFWRVRGVDPIVQGVPINGIWSSSAHGAFTFVNGLTSPTYESPADAAAVTAPTLSWDTVTGALGYKVTIKNSAGARVVDQAVTYSTGYTPATALSAGTYTWFVQSFDMNGTTSALLVNSPARSFTLAAPPSTFTSPDPVSVSSPNVRMPALVWRPVTGASKYTIHYAQNGAELGLLGQSVAYPAYTPTATPLAAGTYTWWVDALDSSNNIVSTGGQSTFRIATISGVLAQSLATSYQTTDTPQTDVVCGGATVCGDTPTFTWTPIPDATSYTVTLAYDRDFTNIAHTYTTQYPTLTPRESLLDSQAGQAYYWWVSACTNFKYPATCSPGADDPTVNSNAATFKKRSRAVRLCPLDATTATDATQCPLSQDPADPNRQITFSWVDYLAANDLPSDNTPAGASPATQEARQYRVDVSAVADFATLLDSVTVDGTSYTPFTSTYPVGPLYWRVAAIDNSNNLLTWSAVGHYTKRLPAPVQNVTYDHNEVPTPPATVVSGIPLLTWQPSDFAVQYNVEIYDNDPTFTSANRVLTAATKFTAFAPSSALPAHTYTWRVQGVDADGRLGPWYTDTFTSPNRPPTNRITFTITTPYPSLTAPADHSELNSGDVRFVWNPVAEAVKYRWQLSTSTAFSSITASQDTVMASWAPTAAFADGSYFWRVQALDANYNVLSSSPARAIAKDATAPTATDLQPQSNLAVNAAMTATFSEPVHAVTPSTFVVTADGSTTPVPGTVKAGSTSATWTPTGLLVPGQTYTIALTSGILDAFGNPLVPRSWTLRATTAVDNTSPSLVEHWDRDAAPAASGGSYDSSDSAGARAVLTFSGTSVSVIGTRLPTGGYAGVYLDNVLQSSAASFYGRTAAYRATVWAKSGLAPGVHTIAIKVLGTRPAAATDHWVYLDAFRVGSATVEQTAVGVHETFPRVVSTAANGGSYDTTTHATAGDTSSRPSYTLSFRGTSISLAGMFSPAAGKAAIYLDNALKATIDLRSTSTYSSQAWGLAGLTDRVHALRIDVIGTATGAGSAVGLDMVSMG